MKYTYTVILDNMEKVWRDNTKTDFFINEEQRNKFNAQLTVESDTEEEAERIRMGMTDIRMWKLERTED